MQAFVFAYVGVCNCVYVCVHVCECAHMCVCMRLHLYVFVFACACICMRVHWLQMFSYLPYSTKFWREKTLADSIM